MESPLRWSHRSPPGNVHASRARSTRPPARRAAAADLGSAKAVRYIGINQREDSVSYARSDTEQSARIRDYRVYVPSDGTSWGSPIKTGSLPGHRGVQFIDIPAATTRHVRLEVVNTYAASTDTTRYKRLRVDETWIGGNYAGGGGSGGTTSLEAETGTLNGSAVVATCATCSGGAKVRFIGDNSANYATLTVQAATAGTRQLTVYGEVDGTRSFFVGVNGGSGTELPMTGTSWSTPTTATLNVTLNAENNTLRFYNNGANAPDLDKITIS